MQVRDERLPVKITRADGTVEIGSCIQDGDMIVDFRDAAGEPLMLVNGDTLETGGSVSYSAAAD